MNAHALWKRSTPRLRSWSAVVIAAVFLGVSCASKSGDSVCKAPGGMVLTASSAARGPNSSYAILPDGTLWSWGANGSGQLGLGDMEDRLSPTQVGTGTTWSSVVSGGGYDFQQQFVLAIQTDDSLWSWGFNSAGELGLGDTVARTTPTKVGSATWTAVVAAADHAVGIQTGGSLWSWGDANNSETGFGNTTMLTVPTLLDAGTWTALAAGIDTTFAIKSNGTLWSWGLNDNGQLGLGDTTPRTTPTQVGSATTWSAVAAGAGNDTVTASHAIGLQTSGPSTTLWAWGANGSGQLGVGGTADALTPTQIGTATNWSAIAGGADFNLALRSDNSLWAWGVDDDGQAGSSGLMTVSTPAQIGTGIAWMKLTAGAAAHHSAAISGSNALYVWGDGGDGQLGAGCPSQSSVPIPVRFP